jgi:hypothetical protein
MMNWANVDYLQIPDGLVKSIAIGGVQVWKRRFLNLVYTSTEADDVTIYGDGKGYIPNQRLNSSGVPTTSGAGEAIHTGFIPYKGGAVRVKGSTASGSSTGNYVCCYDANHNHIRYVTMHNCGTYELQSDGTYMLTVGAGGLANWLSSNFSITTPIAYIRVSMAKCTADNFIVTIDEEIK